MQIIVRDGKAKYAFEDDINLVVNEQMICIPNLNILDLNSNNSTIYSNVTDTPADFECDKYLYDGTNFILNPDWVDDSE